MRSSGFLSIDCAEILSGTSIPTMAESSASPICLACGELAAKKDRRLLDISGRVTIYWKEIISQELEKTQPQIDDVNELLCPGPSFMCRKCFYAYDKLLLAKEVGLLVHVECIKCLISAI